MSICKVCGKPGKEYGPGFIYCDQCLRVAVKILEASERGITKKEIEEIIRTYYVEEVRHFTIITGGQSCFTAPPHEERVYLCPDCWSQENLEKALRILVSLMKKR